MANNKFSKLISSAILFAAASMVTLGVLVSSNTASANVVETDSFTVIGEDLPTSISFDETLQAPAKKVAKVTTKVSKKSTPAAIQTGWTNCRVQVLEQQGSPIAPTVKVCW